MSTIQTFIRDRAFAEADLYRRLVNFLREEMIKTQSLSGFIDSFKALDRHEDNLGLFLFNFYLQHSSENVEVLRSLAYKRASLIVGNSINLLIRGVNIFNIYSKRRILTIARTETGMIKNMELFKIASDLGLTSKRWMCLDDSERHQDRHLVKRPIDFKYKGGGLFPLDPNFEVGQIINCRCFQTYE